MFSLLSTRSHYQVIDSMNNTNLSPVFIVSSSRLGTTLLRDILNASEQIYIPSYILYKNAFFARASP
ncbi:hypothetical protein S7335_5362 [Synechococcus sp. PCC 7335]|nr:hypothetical protein S7335_5362 [Synechococcus sp. PCC 7335]